jgi:DNA replication and repair protein RecF
MYLTRLSLSNYRAFNRLDMEMPRRIVLLVGDNAQGKTSILEAVYYLATFTSLQAQADRQLLNFDEAGKSLAVARIVAEYQRGERLHHLEVRIIQDPNGNGGTRTRKEILLDGVKKPGHEVLGHFNAVIFLPQMMKILEGGPDERRRYLNLMISQAMPGYAQALNEYGQALTQRNALLKQLGERGGDAGQLVYWDGIISRQGAILIRTRLVVIEELERLAASYHLQLTRGSEVLRLLYQPAYDPLPSSEDQYSLPIQTQVFRSGISEEDIRLGFFQRLQDLRQVEIARGMTTIGPHRDEWRTLCNRVDLSEFGSRGQGRTALLALKMAEVAWLQQKTGHWPVLLLDETLAELDLHRRADLLAILDQSEQALLTTTDLGMFNSSFISASTLWRVIGGRILNSEEEI